MIKNLKAIYFTRTFVSILKLKMLQNTQKFIPTNINFIKPQKKKQENYFKLNGLKSWHPRKILVIVYI